MRWTRVFAALLAVFLCHTRVEFGVNASAADVFALALAGSLAVSSMGLRLPRPAIIGFCLVSATVIFASGFWVPHSLGVEVSPSLIARDFMKLLAAFVYIAIGFNLARRYLSAFVLWWFATGSTLVAILGIIAWRLQIPTLQSQMFLNGIRLQGFTSDANYFALLQVAALIVMVELRRVNPVVRGCAIIALSTSIVLSGSKTGAVSLAVFVCYRLTRSVLGIRGAPLRPSRLFLSVVTLFLAVFVTFNLSAASSVLAGVFPGFERLLGGLVDLDSSVSSQGSGRPVAWQTGLDVMALSPLVGIGIGTYAEVGESYFDYGVVAHNTFLQLFAEWGLPISVLFFSLLAATLLISVRKRPSSTGHSGTHEPPLVPIMAVLLVGSLAISLNNMRFFWLVFGMLLAAALPGGESRDNSLVSSFPDPLAKRRLIGGEPRIAGYTATDRSRV